MINELNNILQVSNEYLDNIDFKLYVNHALNVAKEGYFLQSSGREHYRLLAYISSLYDKETLLDIGTYRGFSALGLAHNKKNRVMSFDILKQPEAQALESNKVLSSNIEFKIDNVLNYKDTVMRCPFILLDTAHDGIFEKEFLEFLDVNNWHGLLLMDDINEYPALTKIWANLDKKKYDLTHKGHWSGTGLVVFGE